MANQLLDRIPSRGITKKEHDDYVAMRDRAYTESWIMPHLGNRHTEGGTVPPKSTQTPIDPKSHRQVLH